MREQEAFNYLVSVIDVAVRKLPDFGINETKSINEAIGVLNSKLNYIETLEKTLISKDEFIEKNLPLVSGNNSTHIGEPFSHSSELKSDGAFVKKIDATK